MAKSPVERFAAAADAAVALQAAQRTTGRPVTKAVIEGAARARRHRHRARPCTRSRRVPATAGRWRPAPLGPAADVPQARPAGAPWLDPPAAAGPRRRPSRPPAPGPESATRGRRRAHRGRAPLRPAHPAGDPPIARRPPQGRPPAGPATGRPAPPGRRAGIAGRGPSPRRAAAAGRRPSPSGGHRRLPVDRPALPRRRHHHAAGHRHSHPHLTTTVGPPPVAVADGVTHPDRDAVAARLGGYFQAINDDYETAFGYFSPDSAVVGNGFAGLPRGQLDHRRRAASASSRSGLPRTRSRSR